MRLFPALPALALLAVARAAFAQPAPAASAAKPIDHGPYGPAANQAYQGGGVVLEDKPGAPAPTPEATPPGEAPAGSVKP